MRVSELVVGLESELQELRKFKRDMWCVVACLISRNGGQVRISGREVVEFNYENALLLQDVEPQSGDWIIRLSTKRANI